MRKCTKLLGVISFSVISGAVLYATYEYKKMIFLEEKLDEIPFYKLKNRVSKVHSDDCTTYEIPKYNNIMDKLRVCSNVLCECEKDYEN